MSFAILSHSMDFAEVSWGFLTGVNDVDISTLGLLESAYRLGGKRLKRFVLLGSTVAVMNSFEREDEKGRDYTEEDWNPVTDFSLEPPRQLISVWESWTKSKYR